MDPQVSVVTVTYQHASHIAQCVESVAAQRTTFPVEHLIGEDGSTDGTRELCQELAARDPGRIRLFLRDRKDVLYIMGKPTGRTNFIKLLSDARGKYVAVCEGDDYWTDPLKLQKQVDFLERNPEYVMCFHRAHLLKNGALEPHPIPESIDLNDVRLDDLLRTYNFITMASVVYRNTGDTLPAWFHQVPFGDLALYAILARRGRIACLDDVMSVYRITNTGSWTRLDASRQQRSYLKFYSVLAPNVSSGQRAILARKRMEVLEKMAHARYPTRPRRKWLYLKYLQFTQPA